MIVERIEPHDWRRLKAIRLRALADTPDAFGSTLSDEVTLADEQWQDRLARSDAATFIARTDTQDLGLVMGARTDDGAGLYAMWVAPEARGRGVGDALIAALVHWAKENGIQRILLKVGDWNAHAIALYARNGFEPTGETGTLPPPRMHITEHQRALRLK